MSPWGSDRGACLQHRRTAAQPAALRPAAAAGPLPEAEQPEQLPRPAHLLPTPRASPEWLRLSPALHRRHTGIRQPIDAPVCIVFFVFLAYRIGESVDLPVHGKPFLPYSQSYPHDLPRMTSLSSTGGWMTSYTTCFARKVIMTSQPNTPKRQRHMARFF